MKQRMAKMKTEGKSVNSLVAEFLKKMKEQEMNPEVTYLKIRKAVALIITNETWEGIHPTVARALKEDANYEDERNILRDYNML